MRQPTFTTNLDNTATRAALLGLGLVVSLLVISLLGSPTGPGLAAGSLLLKTGTMWPAAVYLGAAFGLGWPMTRLWQTHSNTRTNTTGATKKTGTGAFQPPCDTATDTPHSSDTLPIQFALGLACLFSLSHILGILGILNPATAISVCILGLGLALAQLLRARQSGGRNETPSLAWLLAAPAVAVLLVAAMMPPGWLWASEYGGFDALSYHLQLPQEWLALGRIQPLEHNVYSYLPGSIEAAFTHLGAMTLAPTDQGLLASDGWRLLSCQALHAGLTLAAAWLTARATQRLSFNLGIKTQTAQWAGAITGCLMLTTPWAVVTGSLAYNESGVNAMLAGVLLVCAQPRMSPAMRSSLVGFLVGAACGFKPTALFFVGLPSGVMLVASCLQFRRVTSSAPRATDSEPRTSVRGSCVSEDNPGLKSGARSDKTTRTISDIARTLAPALLVGAIVGLLTLSPWLIRNFLHSSNPVFPFAADTFSSAHWSADQFARYQAAHSFDGSLTDRLRTLLWTSPTSAPGDAAVNRFRGLANPQWGLLLPMVVIAPGVLFARWRDARTITVILTLSLLTQLLAWLTLTHLQSRFLLPTLPIATVLVGIAFARLRTKADPRPDARAAVALLAGVAIACQTVFLLIAYTTQQRGSPGAALAVFPAFFTDRNKPSPEQTAVGWCNMRPLDEGLVLLVGDSTPLYFGPGVRYHTTYDTSPLGQLMRTHPNDPTAWARSLREDRIGWLLVNASELDRLHTSGWYDPSVTNETMHAFAETLGGPARVWPDEQRYIVRIPAKNTQSPGDMP